MRKLFSLFIVVVIGVGQACTPKEDIRFVSIKNVEVLTDSKGEPILKGDAVFFNPNKMKMKLRKANIEVFVNDKKSAHVQQVYNLSIPANGNFIVPVEAKLTLKEFGLADAVASFLGGRKYKLHFLGNIHASVGGVRIRIPVDHKEETRLKF